MKATYTVEIFRGEEEGGMLEYNTDLRKDALKCAEFWHDQHEKAVIVRDNRTGEKIYDEM